MFTPEGNRSPIVSFYVKKPAKDVQAVLDAERIKVSLHDEDGVRIRVAPAFFNNAAEVKRFLEVCEKLA
jgi:selenocysteine lyase/cysteine desulfurase